MVITTDYIVATTHRITVLIIIHTTTHTITEVTMEGIILLDTMLLHHTMVITIEMVSLEMQREEETLDQEALI